MVELVDWLSSIFSSESMSISSSLSEAVLGLGVTLYFSAVFLSLLLVGVLNVNFEDLDGVAHSASEVSESRFLFAFSSIAASRLFALVTDELIIVSMSCHL